MSLTIFLLAYWVLLVVPGAALTKLINFKAAQGPLSWIALSYIIFALVFINFNYLQLPGYAFTWLILLIVLICIFYLIKNRRDCSKNLNDKMISSLLILIISGLYQALFGSFNEIPSDLYTHLENYQKSNNNLANNSLGLKLTWAQIVSQKSGVFYYLVSTVNQLTNLDTRLVVELVDFSNRTLFLLAIFWFSKILFKQHSKSNLLAYISVLFVSLHMGINVFSYIRYYSFAPTMLAMVIYLYAISIFSEQINNPLTLKSFLINSCLLLTALLATAAIHTQEAMFIGVMIFAISLVATFKRLFRFTTSKSQRFGQAELITILGLLTFTGVYLYSVENLVRAPNAHWRLWEFGEGFWIFPQLTTLNLKLQFIQVTTLWGLVVYLLFFLNIKRYRNNLFVLAGMFSPLITFLNPFFIDTFLRHYNSTTVWRLCYILPIHFVAADLFVHYYQRIRVVSILKKAIYSFILILLVLLLAPIANTWKKVHFSRVPSLAASKSNLSHSHYADLLDFLNSLSKPEKILTDPMLGYMISGLTKHFSERKKFFRNSKFKRFSYYEYDKNTLTAYKDHLLIVNLREKGLSEIGALSQHWRQNEWTETEYYYPQSLIDHLNQNPAIAQQLWSQNGVAVYRLR